MRRRSLTPPPQAHLACAADPDRQRPPRPTEETEGLPWRTIPGPLETRSRRRRRWDWESACRVVIGCFSDRSEKQDQNYS